ncbi:SRPBCC family protein [Aureisphaera galaxeae]|uniref:SRPBCC family protein n=1 Tax=Aureisphaera galaxeae TaxID=1538023 RepID=UPI002350E1CB|nr:SRPBCC family protein [Aureisphaera galaxeae]MDC8005620.1 SRPBCC family protein [Aureisphaera galaxeae]
MTTITLHTKIRAPIDTVFDLSRSIDLHVKSVPKTKERAISGKTKGLLGPDETVTWQGKHFGLSLKHTSKMVSFEKPFQFTDLMVKGHFTYFVHQHLFKKTDEGILMTDILKYRVPFGWIGRWFDRLFLKKHMLQFLTQRNRTIKREAERSSLSEEIQYLESITY